MNRLLPLLALTLPLQGAPLDNSELQEYFAAKAEKLASSCLADINSREDWEKLKPRYREQLFEMLGLALLPAKTELRAEITGKVERDDFIVEKLHFQSLPGLYVTGNLYLPKNVAKPLPTILYLCGHGQVKTNGISYGNKVAYQHHGAWFARNGYACLLLDTIQLGEIEGLHHGTSRLGMWWWNSQGYTPAGVEAWNCIRALDYLETRPEVDKSRFGVTGRSGGGAYSWWITALDERIKVSAPVAGITDLQNHVTDGVVDGHCDCMYFVNTYGWDYPLVAALAAPRPLLICNSDKDTIFPLDGVVRTHAKTKKIYDLYGASNKLGLLITEGPHKDTQDLQLPVFRWFNRHLKGEDPVIEMAATKFFTGQELKVFERLPTDERTTKTHEFFVPATPQKNFKTLQKTLRTRAFGGWPNETPQADVSPRTMKSGVKVIEFTSEENLRLSLYFRPTENPTEVRLQILNSGDLPLLLAAFDLNATDTSTNTSSLNLIRRNLAQNRNAAFFVVRKGADGGSDSKKDIQVRRRHMLLGETLESARVWDIARGVQVLRSLPEFKDLPVHLSAEGSNAANLLMYAAVTAEQLASITLINLPDDRNDEPDYLNYRRFISLEDQLALLKSTTKINVEEIEIEKNRRK